MYSCCFIFRLPLALTTNLLSFTGNVIPGSGTSLIPVAPVATTTASSLVSIVSCFSLLPPAPPPKARINSSLCSPGEFLAPSLLQSPHFPPWNAPTAYCLQGESFFFPLLPTVLHTEQLLDCDIVKHKFYRLFLFGEEVGLGNLWRSYRTRAKARGAGY